MPASSANLRVVSTTASTTVVEVSVSVTVSGFGGLSSASCSASQAWNGLTTTGPTGACVTTLRVTGPET